ncbi:hypothetical protein RYX36_001911 [Vicia faba]
MSTGDLLNIYPWQISLSSDPIVPTHRGLRPYHLSTDGTTTDNNGVKASLDGSATGKRRLPGIRGETNNKSLEAMVINARKESLQWGAAAGIQGGSQIYVVVYYQWYTFKIRVSVFILSLGLKDR